MLPILGVVISLFAWLNVWQAIPLYQGVAAANREEWSEAAVQLDEAVARDTYLSIAHQQSGLAYSALADAGDKQALQQAIDRFEQTSAMDPYWGLNWANLGALYRSQGKWQLAADAFQKATHAAPNAAVFWLNLGECEEMLENKTALLQAIKRRLT